MRIDHLIIKNFKGFKENEFLFHPEFNLIVGDNGTGKTSLLDALSIAVGSWFLGFGDCDTRPIRSHEVRLMRFDVRHPEGNEHSRSDTRWERQYPCSAEASGKVLGKSLSWLRSRNTMAGKTTSGKAKRIRELAKITDDMIRSGGEVCLPVIAYYGTGRLWNVPREQAQVRDEKKITQKGSLSRLAGYQYSLDPHLSPAKLVRWIAHQYWIAFQQNGQPSPLFQAVQSAVIGCTEGAENLYFDAALGEVVVEMSGQGAQTFNNLSDGQRCMLAMVGDIAQKAAILNPHLGSRVLREIPGIVLIDELDLHLHPIWQRRVIDDLRRTFPKIQFFATTHSPQLIGQIKLGEIIHLDAEPNQRPGQSYGMDSNWILRHIMGSEDRDPAISDRLDRIFEDIEESEFAQAEEAIKTLRSEIGEHPDLVEAEALISRYTRFDNDEEV